MGAKDSYLDVQTKYSDLDIIRSNVALRSDTDLYDRVVEQVENMDTQKGEDVESVKKFYSYLDEKLKDFDAKGANVDFSTLVMAAARECSIKFPDAYLAIEADQVYHLQTRREETPIIGQIFKLLSKHPKMRQYFEKKDREEAERIVNQDLHTHVMNLKEVYEEQIARTKAYGQQMADWGAEMNAHALEMDMIMQSGKGMAANMKDVLGKKPKRKKVKKKVKKKSAGLQTKWIHPDCDVPFGYVQDEWMVDALIQDIYEKLDTEQ